MARACGDDLRGRVLDAASEGASARASVARFGVGMSTAIVWIRRARLAIEDIGKVLGNGGMSPVDGQLRAV